MSTPTLSSSPMDRKLFNLLRAGSARVSRLLNEGLLEQGGLDQGKLEKARSLCERINAVIAHQVRHARGGCECSSLPTEIRAVYDAYEFKTTNDSGQLVTDCGPLCWDDTQQACVECSFS